MFLPSAHTALRLSPSSAFTSAASTSEASPLTTEGTDATLLSNKVQMLLEMFPILEEAETPALLRSNNMGVQETISAILGVSGTFY